MNILKTKVEEMMLVRLDKNKDLLQSITDFCIEKSIKSGSVECIGAVQNACLSYYDQDRLEYIPIRVDKKLEIASLSGNISIKDNLPFVHVHAVFSDEYGYTFGGHLAFGTKVFAAELLINKFSSEYFERELDSSTELYLWNKKVHGGE